MFGLKMPSLGLIFLLKEKEKESITVLFVELNPGKYGDDLIIMVSVAK